MKNTLGSFIKRWVKMAETDGGTDRKGSQFAGEGEFFRGSSRIALRYLYEETLDIDSNVLGRAATWVGT